jgi:hypothetical protein
MSSSDPYKKPCGCPVGHECNHERQQPRDPYEPVNRDPYKKPCSCPHGHECRHEGRR